MDKISTKFKGSRRTVHVMTTDENGTINGYINYRGKQINGTATTVDGVTTFTPSPVATTETPATVAAPADLATV